ncbi:phosphotransferase KptA/Tpt1 [Chytriomyces cf. hyalinus JEL632]|nr:phosphotransferase KptA/Tpt1 [Chytriomyces cf. hyalinus JEL632]
MNRNSRPAQNPDVILSKAVSKILRHDTAIPMRQDGYVRLKDLLSRPQLRGKNLMDVQYLVESNDKQRYTLIEENGDWLIKANQGHSREVDVELVEIVDASEIPTVIHGTYLRNLSAIESQGLSKMNRNHIHFAVGRPGDSGVISGMRGTCNVLIYINVSQAMSDGIKFYRSPNNVVLSSGVGGFIAPKYFERVEKTGHRVQ